VDAVVGNKEIIMSLSKVQIVDSIDVAQNNFVQVRTKTTIVENGIEIASTFHRHIIAPGYDYSAEDARVQAICAATHTDEVIAEYKAATAKKGV
jgi:hypothetical protein